MISIIRLPHPTAAQTQWTEACERSISRLREVQASLSDVTCIPLDETRSINQILGSGGSVVANLGMETFAVNNRVARSDKEGRHIGVLWVCLFREPDSMELEAVSRDWGDSKERGQALARELYVNHELMHSWQEQDGFRLVLSGLLAGECDASKEAARAIDQLKSAPTQGPRPKGFQALESQLIFEEFCSDALACKLTENTTLPASELARGLSRVRLARAEIESGRYQHGQLLSDFFANEKLRGLDWPDFVKSVEDFCKEKAGAFLRASRSPPRQQETSFDVTAWRAKSPRKLKTTQLRSPLAVQRKLLGKNN